MSTVRRQDIEGKIKTRKFKGDISGKGKKPNIQIYKRSREMKL
jgi:hypothetical protein